MYMCLCVYVGVSIHICHRFMHLFLSVHSDGAIEYADFISVER